MPKRRYSRSREEDIDHYKNKIRKLERKIRDRICDSKDVSEAEDIVEPVNEDIDAATPSLRPDDWLLEWPENEVSVTADNAPEPQAEPNSEPVGDEPTAAELDTETLAILGDAPPSSEQRGSDIRKELASRLLHIVKEGLSKDNRKDLISKYPVPANCVEIEAPKINPEIKAAITEAAVKRDKGIENKQKQMSCAISCLAEIIDSQLNCTSKNNVLLQKLMDTNKILCDLQHADSITRKNFILFSLKNDMKEHLKNTKIDTYLFGENLSETLRSAKAVNKSGVELKAESNKPATTFKGAPTRPLNRRAPPQARRPLAGQAPPTAPRSRESAVTRVPYHPPRQQHHPPQQAQSSKTSSQAQHGTYYPRRRF